jgi:phosphoglucosamine mutase
MERLFGTDGVRGTAGEFPLDPGTVARIGAALVRALPDAAGSPRLLAGRDTRESSVGIEQALARGATSAGASFASAGVMPTPGVAFLTRSNGFAAGVVISASHNPYHDNGIKIFSGRGEKFTDDLERRIERLVGDRSWDVPDGPAAVAPVEHLAGAYVDHLIDILPARDRLRGRRIAVDCANGATAPVAPLVFRRAGLDPVVVGDRPDGRNINLDSGALHPEVVADVVRANGCSFGVAFDGDGDRAILADHRGALVNGDAILLILARYLQQRGRLRGGAVVATVMSNLGLELALRDAGIALIRCAVGDKYVMEEMVRRDLALGGEQSGHVIIADHLFTGDGIGTALAVLQVMAETGRELADLAGELVVYPQVLKNVRVREKQDLQAVAPVARAMAQVEARLAGQGRLLVRYSGTEPLLRVMVEGRNQREIDAWAEEIADQVRKHLG